MTRVGLTGGIGSGKSIICQVFRLLNVPVFHADEEAKDLYDSHEGVREKMTGLIGKDLYTGHKIDRQKLARLIFRDKELLKAVQHIVHPEVAARFESWCGNKAGHSYVVHEAAILFESGADRGMDVCITVMAPAEIRLERILQRSGITREIAAQVMENQMPEEEKADRSQHIIWNDNLHLVIPQVLHIHHMLEKGNSNIA